MAKLVHAIIGGLAMLTIAACGGGSTQAPGAAATRTSAASASQSQSDALRDGVVPAVAALTFAQRVDVVARQATSEGIWVISKPSSAATSGTSCRIGPESGTYPVDWVCSTEYGELLLLDATGSTIVRAYPLPAVPPNLLVVTDAAVYCGHTANPTALLPDAMVCRVDRRTLVAAIRIFPAVTDSVVVQPCFVPPATWTLDRSFLDVRSLRSETSALNAVGASGTATTLDPLTLAITGTGRLTVSAALARAQTACRVAR